MRQPAPFFRSFDGWWYVQLRVGGTRRQIKLAKGEENREAALQRWHEIMAVPQPKRVPIAVSSDSVKALLDQFLDHCRSELSPTTADWYDFFVQSFSGSIHDALSIDALQVSHVTDWLRTQKRWSKSTKSGAVQAIRRAFRWLSDEGRIRGYPLKGLKGSRKRQREVIIPPETFEKLLAASRPNFRDLLTFLLSTGCRPQEARVVEHRHVDLSLRRIVFPASEAKGGEHPRVIYLNDDAFAIVEPLCHRYASGAIFRNSKGNAWTRNAIRCRFRRLREKVAFDALPAGVEFIFHAPRIVGDRREFVGEKISIVSLDAEDHARLGLENHGREIVVAALKLRQTLVREEHPQSQLADLGKGRFDVWADEILELVEKQVGGVADVARQRSCDGKDFVEDQRADGVRQLGREPILWGQIEQHDLAFAHEALDVEPALGRTEHPTKDGALEVGLQTIPGRIQDLDDLARPRADEFAPFVAEPLGEALQELAMVRTARHEKVDAVRDRETKLRRGPEGVEDPAGESGHRVDVLAFPGPEHDLGRPFDFVIAVGIGFVEKRIEAKDDVLAPRLDVDQTPAHVVRTEVGRKPEEQFVRKIPQAIEDEPARLLKRIEQ